MNIPVLSCHCTGFVISASEYKGSSFLITSWESQILGNFHAIYFGVIVFGPRVLVYVLFYNSMPAYLFHEIICLMLKYLLYQPL